MSGAFSNRRSGFVGRERAMARLTGALDRSFAGRSILVLMSGQAGIGKTALAARLADEASARGATTAWGTCWHSEQAPGFWPWTQVIRSLSGDISEELVAGLAPSARAQLARLAPELGWATGSEPPRDSGSEQARFELFAATAAFLERTARLRPLLVVLDDLQWADPSSLDLLQFVARRAQPVPLFVMGAYRHDEIDPGSSQARVLVELAGAAEPLRLAGLDEEEVAELVRLIAGDDIAERWAAEVKRRSGGHPFFVRELSHLIATHPGPGEWVAVPAAVREVIERRLARLTPACVRVLEAAAVSGNEVLPDILADVCQGEPAQLAEFVAEAVRAGILVADPSLSGHVRFAHDLFRETLYEGLSVRQRLLLHQQVGRALESRHARGGADFPGEMARHFAAAIAIDGPERAVRWAIAAARADGASLAFTEAATHLERLRQAAQDNGIALAPETMVDLLVIEAADRARSGDATSARALLERARELARRLSAPEWLAAVALGLQRLGARFGMPRPEVVDVLEEARSALAGVGSAVEAQVTASLARELAHSVFAQRSRARPLSERALEVARVAGDPATLASCLLARHDVVWGPGTAAERLGLASEIAEMADRAGDRERRAEGVLLRANALLELGSPAFRAELAEYLRLAGELRQPRHDYLVLTRRAALALLDGRIGEGERLIEEASALGKQIGEPDEVNVQMTQTLGARWARGDREELAEFAKRAVAWWVGIPAYSYAVAAGFWARGGALDDARRALAVSRELDEWKEDRSLLRSAFVGLSVEAGARLGDRQLCAELYDELAAVAGTCAVNGAVVCFMGSYAHWAGVAAAALGHLEDAAAHLEAALATHEHLGARAWEAESCAELADVLGVGGERYRARAAGLAAELGLGAVAARVGLPMPPAPAAGPDGALAVLRRDGELWEVGFSGRSARVRDAKGLHDLAALLSRPGVDVHVLDLASPQAPKPGLREPALDSRARAEYRRRLVGIEEERSEAERHRDDGRLLRLDGEREAVLAELRAAAGLGGRTRHLGGDATERARKAVTSRLREAIRRIEAVLPELGAHLDRSVVTGTTCRYQPVEPVSWSLRGD
jgi:hypothetical protein